ncbi:putative LPS assembly protein LptD [Hufsiella arboris]|uniref:putative LPS assembly protein LptD n=1 Tax=Hufsiella arboris TaxID=2695275 RepID=UPI001F3FE74E|nr:putative LPS assembly protein LptD [Hufsiella arboris]
MILLAVKQQAHSQLRGRPPGSGRTQSRSAAKKTTPDTLKSDTVINKKTATGLTAAVKAVSEDSMYIDKMRGTMYLWGKARVTYEDFELDADYIRLDQKNNKVFASGMHDKRTGKYTGRPIFKTGGEPPAATDSMYYDFKSKRGKTFGVSSEVEGGYILAGQSKKNEYDEVFIKDAIYTTCDLPHPHYGIHLNKGIVSEKNIVTRSAYLVIEDVPFPLILPFGFFPKANHRASGILFPTFGEDASRGFYMRDLGWYFGISDYWDAELRGSIYSKGSYETSLLARYRKNYKYDGNISLRYASIKTGVEGTVENKPSKQFNIQWSHSQRQEANPGTTFGASVNVGTSQYFTKTAAGGTYDLNAITQNSLSSSINYGKTFANNLFNFTAALTHRQDLQRHTVDLTLPSFSLNMSTLSPFDKKDRVGEQKWYQRLTVGYSLQGSNSVTTFDSLLFKPGAFQRFQNGFQQNIPVSLSLNVLKFFQFNSSVNYTDRLYLQSYRKSYLFAPAQEDVIDTVRGFGHAYDYSLSTGLSTKLYGTVNFKKGKLVALRHIITPQASFNYRPDFGASKYGYYRDIQRSKDPNAPVQHYSIYDGAIYGTPPYGKQAGISFSVDNNIEAKVRSKSDTTNAFEKIPILQGLSFSGNYNFAADSFKLSPISFSGRTALLKQKLGINFYGTFDPYQVNSLGNRVNEYALSRGQIARLTNIGLSCDFSFNSEAVKRRNDNADKIGQSRNNMTPQQAEALARISRDPNSFVDFNVPWNITASYSFNYSKPGLYTTVSNTLNFSGDLSVTPKWKVQYTSGYDFRAQKMSLTQFSFYRDLHCWDMSFRWVPFGPYQSYSFDLRVKASILQDLKLNRRRDYFNNY